MRDNGGYENWNDNHNVKPSEGIVIIKRIEELLSTLKIQLEELDEFAKSSGLGTIRDKE